ncbi:MAG: hypothetical protein WCF16_02180 [Alphaproteobacteria bacterium]
MAWVLYDKFRKAQFDQVDGVDLDTDTLKIMLTTSVYSPAQATDGYKSDVSNEVSGTNYTAAGAALSGKTVTLASGTVTFDANDVTWLQSATGFSNARKAVLYKDTGVATTSRLIAYADFGADKGNVSGDLTLQMDAAGIITSP